MLKWIVIGVLIVCVVFIGYRIYGSDVINARVAEEIRANPQGERAKRAMLVTLADGRMYPVNYLREESLLFMGIDGRWWRDLVGDGQPVVMLIQGENLKGHAKTVLDKPEYIADIFSRFRRTGACFDRLISHEVIKEFL